MSNFLLVAYTQAELRTYLTIHRIECADKTWFRRPGHNYKSYNLDMKRYVWSDFLINFDAQQQIPQK